MPKVDLSITELATGQVVATPELVGAANADMTFTTDKDGYEYTVRTRADANKAVSSIEVRRSGNMIFRQQLAVAVTE
jgi:hypothetical protein